MGATVLSLLEEIGVLRINNFPVRNVVSCTYCER